MFVLGVDPGLAICGYGLIEKTTRGPVARAAGVIRTDPEATVAQRLAELHEDFVRLIAEGRPEQLAIEQVFTNRNLRTAVSVGRASGVVMLAAAGAGIPVSEYTPSQVKLAVAGYGAAPKDEIAHVVGRRLELSDLHAPVDAYDALAVALCHLQSSALGAKLEAAMKRGA